MRLAAWFHLQVQRIKERLTVVYIVYTHLQLKVLGVKISFVNNTRTSLLLEKFSQGRFVSGTYVVKVACIRWRRLQTSFKRISDVTSCE